MRFDRGHFASALLGALVAALVLAALPATAGNGDPLHLGERNSARRVTKVRTKGGVTFISAAYGTPAATFQADGGPAFAVNSTWVVERLNADLLDGVHYFDMKPELISCVELNADDTESYECDAGSFYAPTAGWMVTSGSIEVYNQSGADDSMMCAVTLNDGVVTHSSRNVTVPISARGICATDAVIGIDAGVSSFAFTLESVNSGTDIRAAAFSAIFIPIGPG